MGDLELTLEALKEGADIEKTGIAFYKDASEKVEDKNGKATLEFFSKEEGRHLKVINDIRKAIEAGKGIDANLVGNIRHAHIFPNKEDYAKGVQGEGDRKILEEAKGIEERSIAFYSGFLEKVSGDEFKDIFRTLVKEEESHLEWVNFMMGGLEVNGYWYGLEDMGLQEG